MNPLKIVAILLVFLTVSCTKKEEKEIANEIQKELDGYLTKAMELHHIPGLAFAVIQNNQVIYKNYFGKASLENDHSVDKNTLFRIFSATKLITSTAVFQLIQDGKLQLEDTISKYLDKIPSHWQKIKIKHLLSHSSGLPDLIRFQSTLSDNELIKKLSEEKMEFTTGNQFRYNQTNYWLLAQIIEKISQMTFDEYVLKNQFQNATHGVLFSSNSQEMIPNRAIRYFYNEKTSVFEKDQNNNGKRGHSGNGLNITLNKFIEWNKQLDHHKLLSPKSKSEMWTPFHFNNKKDHFLHGWGIYCVNGLNSYGFTGGNLAAYRKFVDHDVTIILLSNGYKIPAYDILVNDAARLVIPILQNKNLTLEEEVMQNALNYKFKEAAIDFKKLKKENPNGYFDNLKWNINSLGNSLTFSNKPSKALEVYKINAAANPNWWVSLASLAESYELQKDTINALKNYKRAIDLNKKNEWNYNEIMKKKIVLLKK